MTCIEQTLKLQDVMTLDATMELARTHWCENCRGLVRAMYDDRTNGARDEVLLARFVKKFTCDREPEGA